MSEEIKSVDAKIDEAEAAMKKYASKDTVISIGGYEFTPAKLMVAFTIVSSTLGGLYGAFEVYKDYQGMKKKIAEYVAPDLSELNAKMDIVVEKGPTEFGPGPIVGEFNAVGIPAKIDKGKVAIQKTTTVVNKGDPISADLGIMLSKLDINPIEIGIILTGAIEDGFLFEADSLDLDTDGFRTDIITATSGAFNLACNIRWFSSQTIDRKSTRLNSSHVRTSRMPSSA